MSQRVSALVYVLIAGYRFKSFDAARAMATANPNEDLKSPEELEEEDRAAKSAVSASVRQGQPVADARNCKSLSVAVLRETLRLPRS